MFTVEADPDRHRERERERKRMLIILTLTPFFLCFFWVRASTYILYFYRTLTVSQQQHVRACAVHAVAVGRWFALIAAASIQRDGYRGE